MSIFKYFTNEAHALALVEKGTLMLRPLSYFRAIEADGVRGDPRDGILTHAPEGGLVMNMEDGRKVKLEGGSFNSSVNQKDVFVYCASDELSPDLAEKFGAFCVELPDPDMLVRRLKARAHPNSQFDYHQIASGKVDYREHNTEPGVDWALPERLVLIKPPSFSWQKEFRIAVGKRDTMNVENVVLTIQTGPADGDVQSVPPPIFIKVSRIPNLILHRF